MDWPTLETLARDHGILYQMLEPGAFSVMPPGYFQVLISQSSVGLRWGMLANASGASEAATSISEILKAYPKLLAT
eukprot:5025622-Alexandrium_andersonii.AAC.1